ncbi:MAG: 2,3-diphosphoglycerate-dependent phosphoglycerate mutase [Bacteroidales bacterium]|nr:2,3-diphosphoglycerate-dependent phosphoglycerate mutase [Bacteroidales bacterium]
MYKLILIRHGQSEWNLSNQFTGWTDVDLTPQGVEEAKQAGRILRDSDLDIRYTYTSFLKRAIKTLNYVLEEMDRMWLPVEKTWRLNEKHYGMLQGQNKAQAVQDYGEENVTLWRRSYDVAPAPIPDDDPRHPKYDIRYQDIKYKAARPGTESLADATRRIIPLWNVSIVESLRQYKQVLVVAHGNSIRGIIKFMKNMSNEEIVKLNIPTGVPYLMELDDEMQVISDRYIGLSEEELRAKQESVANQTKQLAH